MSHFLCACGSDLGGQDQAEVKHQQTVLEQSRTKKNQTQQNIIEIMFFLLNMLLQCLPVAPLHPLRFEHLWATDSDPEDDLHKLHPPAEHTQRRSTVNTF